MYATKHADPEKLRGDPEAPISFLQHRSLKYPYELVHSPASMSYFRIGVSLWWPHLTSKKNNLKNIFPEKKMFAKKHLI